MRLLVNAKGGKELNCCYGTRYSNLQDFEVFNGLKINRNFTR